MGELWRFGTSCAKFVNFFSGHSAPIFGMVVCVCFAAKTLDNFSFMAIFLASTVPTGTLSGKGVVLGAKEEGNKKINLIHKTITRCHNVSKTLFVYRYFKLW